MSYHDNLKFQFFDRFPFMKVAVTALDAENNAQVANEVLEKASFVMYGRFNGKDFVEFSTYRKNTDTHKLLAFAPAQMFIGS